MTMSTEATEKGVEDCDRGLIDGAAQIVGALLFVRRFQKRRRAASEYLALGPEGNNRMGMKRETANGAGEGSKQPGTDARLTGTSREGAFWTACLLKREIEDDMGRNGRNLSEMER